MWGSAKFILYLFSKTNENTLSHFIYEISHEPIIGLLVHIMIGALMITLMIVIIVFGMFLYDLTAKEIKDQRDKDI